MRRRRPSPLPHQTTSGSFLALPGKNAPSTPTAAAALTASSFTNATGRCHDCATHVPRLFCPMTRSFLTGRGCPLAPSLLTCCHAPFAPFLMVSYRQAAASAELQWFSRGECLSVASPQPASAPWNLQSLLPPILGSPLLVLVSCVPFIHSRCLPQSCSAAAGLS